MYVTYDFYSSSYGGTQVSSAEFEKYELKARYTLDSFTLKPKMTLRLLEGEHKDRIQLAMCELIDNTKEEETLKEHAKKTLKKSFSGIESETVKDHSVKLSKGNAVADVERYILNKDLDVIAKYLTVTNLLYRGV